jgi:hypothetical protein
MYGCRELHGLSEYIIIFSKIFNNKNNFLEILCATIYDQADRYKKNRNGTTSFENLFAYYYNIDVLLRNFNETNNVCLVDGKNYLFTFE